MSPLLKITAAGWLLTSLGHTISSQDWRPSKEFQSLPNLAYSCSTVGWYQGSGFFILTALLNYSWSENSSLLRDPIHQYIATLIVIISWATSAWYAKRRLPFLAMVMGAMGGLQRYASWNL